MKARPVHRDWHDYESFLWILCFITLRHAHGVSWYEGPSIYHCNGVEDRLKVLQILFPDVDRTGNSAIDHLAAAKQRLFVRTSKLSVGSNPPVATLIRKLLDIFRPLHEALTTAHHLCAELEVYTSASKYRSNLARFGILTRFRTSNNFKDIQNILAQKRKLRWLSFLPKFTNLAWTMTGESNANSLLMG
jgi:hypothetical protein